MLSFNSDCLVLVFKELRDKKSFHSCLLVNRQWCHLVVPILWRRYSWCVVHNTGKSERKLHNTILSWLPPSSKRLLSDNDILLPSNHPSKPPLFNYISFCEFPEPKIVDNIVEMVIETFNMGNPHKRNLFEQELYKFFVSQCNKSKTLKWSTSQPLSSFPGALTCFYQLYSLYIDIDLVNSNALYELSHICKNLGILTIYKYSQDLPGLIALINAQENLKSVSLYPKGTCKEISNVLARKGNTINHLHLGSINIILPSFLTSFIHLKKISIHNGEKYQDFRKEIREFQRYLAISEFPELQSFAIDGISCFKELAMLIERTKGDISNVFISSVNKTATNSEILIKAIANNCPKIEILSTYLVPNDFIHVKSLLINCRNLKLIEFISLNFYANENDNIGDELLNILTNFSPNSLTDITISGDWKCSIDALERFFESCRERTLSCFDIKCHNRYYITEGHKVVIRKYINERVIKDSNIR